MLCVVMCYVMLGIDTGSQVNILSAKVAELLELQVTPTNITLKGFSGGLVTSRGEVEFHLEIDDAHLRCTAQLVDVDMQTISLLIGQPVINSEGMSLVVSNGTVTFKQEPSSFPNNMDVVEECNRFKVVTSSKERLPPGVSIIKVQILGNNTDNDVATAPRHFELQEQSYSIPATLLRGSEGYMKIINTGSGNIVWPPGEVLTRAESCEEQQPLQSQVSHNNINLAIKMPVPINCLSSSSTVHNKALEGIDVDQLKIGPLNKTDYKRLILLLNRYNSCFSNSTHDLGCTDLVQMKIKITTNQPIHRQPYRLSHVEQEIVRSKTKAQLNAGIIKESESDYASPVLLVKKKNGDYRLCVDYRALNAITIKDRYPLPNIDNQVSKLAGKKFFTCLDMAQSYYQLLISPEDTHKTAFVTPQGHLEYTRIQFGLANAPSVLCV